MIQRYALWIDEDGALSLHPHDAGKCVLYADHLREIERLNKAIEICWFNDDDTTPLQEWRDDLLLEASAKIEEERAVLTQSPEEKP